MSEPTEALPGVKKLAADRIAVSVLEQLLSIKKNGSILENSPEKCLVDFLILKDYVKPRRTTNGTEFYELTCNGELFYESILGKVNQFLFYV